MLSAALTACQKKGGGPNGIGGLVGEIGAAPPPPPPRPLPKVTLGVSSEGGSYAPSTGADYQVENSIVGGPMQVGRATSANYMLDGGMDAAE